jgi:phosphoglycolate phosphatase
MVQFRTEKRHRLFLNASERMTPTPAYLFDLDGTLVDTAPDLLATMNMLLTRAGHAPLGPEVLRRLVGRGARNLIADTFKVAGAPLTPEAIEPLYADFLKDYGSHIAAASRPFPGVIETLEQLKAEGVRMGVLTNKPHPNAMQLLTELDLTGYFETITGGSKYPWLKPDPRLFETVLADLGGRPAIMVGDSVTDVQAARAGGAPVILMSYGYTPEPATVLGADLVLDDFREVPAAAKRLMGDARQ